MARRTPDSSEIAHTIASQCLARRARLLSRRITRIYEDSLRSLDVTASQLTILAAVGVMPGARPSNLHPRLDLEQSTFSRNAALMKRNGWVSDETGADARSHGLVLTEAGKALLAEALPLWRDAQRKARRMLGADSAQMLIEQPIADLADPADPPS